MPNVGNVIVPRSDAAVASLAKMGSGTLTKSMSPFPSNCFWNAVKNSAKNMNPEGYAAKTDTWAMTNLSQSFNYEMICQASGGYGERVEDPAEVPAAIERALHSVQVEKRQALLNIIGA